MEKLLFTDLFSPRPDDWELRGDPHLWDELSAYLAEVPCQILQMQFARSS